MTQHNEPLHKNIKPEADAGMRPSDGKDEEKGQPAFALTPLDRQVLSMKDEDYRPHTWENLRDLIDTNRLDLLTRTPSQLAAYLTWTAETKREWGSMTAFIASQRVRWQILPESSASPGSLFAYKSPVPFEDPADYKILMNDWPYGLDNGIVHLVVWLKNKIPTGPEGDMTQEGRELVEAFVQKTFVRPLEEQTEKVKERDGILCFKNWTALQSVRSLEHVHVLARKLPEGLLAKWTEADESLKVDQFS